MVNLSEDQMKELGIQMTDTLSTSLGQESAAAKSTRQIPYKRILKWVAVAISCFVAYVIVFDYSHDAGISFGSMLSAIGLYYFGVRVLRTLDNIDDMARRYRENCARRS